MDRRAFKIRRRSSRKGGAITMILALVLIVVALAQLFINRRVDFWQYYGLDKNNDSSLVIGSEPISGGIARYDGIFYISLDALQTYIDPDIYYNADEGRVIITTNDAVVRLEASADTYSVNDERIDLNFPVYDDNGTVYLPAEITERIYNAEIMHQNGIFSVDIQPEKGRLLKNTKLYVQPGKRSAFCKLEKDTEFNIYTENDGYLLVKVTSGKNFGFVGYVTKKLVFNEGTEPQPEREHTVRIPDGRIDLVFDQISNAAGAAVTMENGLPNGVNVLCPTWFSFKDSGGEIVNKANMDYVNWAHANGCFVWGLVTDNFDAGISHAILTNDQTREYAIRQLVAYAQMYDLDGVNIDFESVPSTDGAAWIQFLRELVPLCHQNGLTVSTDLFVPKNWTAHYERSSVGEIVDYAIVMGYDEHYSGSESAGSVASISWSVTAVEDTLKAGVPAEKLVLGIPFYTRIWLEKTGGGLENGAYSMDAAAQILAENNADITFDETTGQNYGEYTDAQGRHRCWIEDSESVAKRAALVAEYDIAGIAAWKLRMETDGIFDIITDSIQRK